MTTVMTGPITIGQRSGAAASGFIPEIQGLRTVALILVATFHVWFDRVSGGVDIFLLISAYLLTRSLASRAERGVLTNPASFVVRKFARLMPLTFVAAAAILVVGFLLMRPPAWPELLSDAAATFTYTENFRLQALATDYFAVDQSLATPFQHYWSLAIQGQVFVLWAIVHFLIERLARATRLPLRPTLLSVFAIVFGLSLAWSVFITGENQAYAYFDTGARLWEFAAGSMFALIQPWLRLPSWLRAGMGWVGLFGVVSCGFLLPVQSTFPGYTALWPVVSAALIILAAGGVPTSWGPDRILASRLLDRIGSYTFALYLVHWPVLIFTLRITAQSKAGWWLGTLVLLVSVVLSVLLVHTVERPVAKWSNRGQALSDRVLPGVRTHTATTLVASLAFATVVGVGAVAVTQQGTAAYEAAIEAGDYSALGANANPGSFHDGEPLPAGIDSSIDWTITESNCAADVPYLCLDTGAPGDGAAPFILMVGNSHIGQLAAIPLETQQRDPSWRVQALAAADCSLPTDAAPTYPDCETLWADAERIIETEQPEVVIVMATKSIIGGEQAFDGLPEWIETLHAVSPNTTVIAVRDNPRFEVAPLHCVMEQDWLSQDCINDYVYATNDVGRDDLEAVGAVWVDLNPWICPDDRCHPATGGVVTYLDDNHLTETYTQTLAGRFADQVRHTVVWWPADPYHPLD